MAWSRSKSLALALAAALFLCLPAYAGLGDATQNGDSHNGREAATDIPMSLRLKNTAGTDGAGLCVWTSAEMAARYQNTRELIGVIEYMRTQKGGGWPDRVDQVMRERAPNVQYKQYVGADLQFIKDGIDSGRPVCVTYGYGEFYGRQTISHMVLCVYMDDAETAILDNNDPGHLWWMPTGEFAKRFAWPTGNGWAWYTLTPPPPPAPHN